MEKTTQSPNTDSNHIIIECLISYLDPTQLNSSIVKNKERKRIRIPITPLITFKSLILQIKEQCGLNEEAEKRGLGNNIEVKIARLQKCKDGPKAYSISTQSAWELEMEQLKLSDDTLQVTVLKKEIVFAKHSPVIQFNLISSSESSDVQQNKSSQSKGKRGKRKKTDKTLEDEDLAKRIKLGEDGNKLRNPRQEKDFSIMTECALKLSGSKPLDLQTIQCGQCGRKCIVSNAFMRTPESRVLYFKSSHFDKRCSSITAKEDAAAKAKKSTKQMQDFMSNWSKVPQEDETQGDDQLAIDIDKEQEDSDIDRLDDDEHLIDEAEVSSDWTEDPDLQIPNYMDPLINREEEYSEEPSVDSDLEDDEEILKPDPLLDLNQDFAIFPVSIEKADEVCVKLNDLISRGIISKERIFYKYLADMCNIFYDIRMQYDPDVVEFFNTIKYLGGERTVNFIRGPMWHGCGKGGEKKAEDSKMNFGGPSRTTIQNKSVGYTTKSGVNKTWLRTFFKLETDNSTGVVPFVDTETVRVYAVSMQNDGTALKPGLEFDEQQHINVGLTRKIDISFVTKHPNPDPEFLKSNVVTEANVTYLTTVDNSVSFPISVTYLPKCGKTGSEMRDQFLSEINVYQMCLACVERTASQEHILLTIDADRCCSSCTKCLELRDVCDDCKKHKQTSYQPSLRACSYCLQNGQTCIRNAVLALSTDCEAGNKAALESIIEDRKNGSLPPKYIFSCMPDAVHVGKSLKAGFANWMLLLGKERGCLAILHNLRDSLPSLRRILSKNAVMNKDRMDIECILQLTKDSVLETLGTVDRVVHNIVPDQFRISPTNKVGMYPHPIAVTCGDYGKALILDYQPMKKKSRLLEVKFHVPADVNVLLECKDARSLAYTKGIVYVCNFGESIEMFQAKKATVKSMKRDEIETLLTKRNLSVIGSVLQLREKLQKVLVKEENDYKKKGIDLSKVLLSEEISPSCIATAAESMLVIASDERRTLFTCDLKHDGVIMRGAVHRLTDYPPSCNTVLCLSMKGSFLLGSFGGDPGGIFKFRLDTQEKQIVLSNGTNECKEVHGIAAIQEDEFVFTDMGDHTVKRYCNAVVELLAGTGQEGNNSGPAEKATFSQPMGVCIEYGTNIYVTDAQCGCMKLITTVKNSIIFLEHLRMLYSAFSVHLKHVKVPKLTVQEAIEKVELLSSFLRECESKAQDTIGVKKATNGPEGTVACKTVRSVEMIKSELSNLTAVLSLCNSDYPVDLQSLLTVQVENLHATSHFKEQFPTCLQYARNLSDTVHESVKRVVTWSAHYYTHPQSYYPIPHSRRSLSDLPTMDHLSPVRTLTSHEKETMKNWASDFGKCVRQRTVRQETTKFKAGTLPLNMYQVSSKKPGEKVSFGKSGSPVVQERSKQKASKQNVEVENAEETWEQFSEYDSDSEEEPLDTDQSSSELSTIDTIQSTSAALDFMRAVTTRSGRTVKVSVKYQ